LRQLPFFAGLGEWAHEESHQGFGYQASLGIGDVAIHDGKVPADSHHLRIGGYGAAFDPFQIINFHFDGSDPRSQRTCHVTRQTSGSIGEGREDAAMDYSVNLQMTGVDLHAQPNPAARGLYESESHLPGGAVFFQAAAKLLRAEALQGSCGFARR
jgi:hypothetical protein